MRRQSAWQFILGIAMLIGPGLTGCASCNLMGGILPITAWATKSAQYRKPDGCAKDGVSTKAQQVEKDLGY